MTIIMMMITIIIQWSTDSSNLSGNFYMSKDAVFKQVYF